MKYFMHINGQQQGPFEMDELLAKGMNSDTPVWCEGMPDWIPAKDVPALSSLLIPSTPPQYAAAAPPAYAAQPEPVAPQPATYVADAPRCRSGLALAILNLCAPAAIFLVYLLTFGVIFRYAGRQDDPLAAGTAIFALASIIVTILGVISLIFAINSKAAYGRGQYDVSRRRGKVARTLGWIGLIIAIIAIIGIVIVGATNNDYYSYSSYYGYYY